MVFSVYGKSNGIFGRQYRQFEADGRSFPVIGMLEGEQYEVRIFNSFFHPIEILLIDGGGSLKNDGKGNSQKFVVSGQNWLRVGTRVYGDASTNLIFGEVGWPEKLITVEVWIETARPPWNDRRGHVELIKPEWHKSMSINCLRQSDLRALLEEQPGGSPVSFKDPDEGHTTAGNVNYKKIDGVWRFTD